MCGLFLEGLAKIFLDAFSRRLWGLKIFRRVGDKFSWRLHSDRLLSVRNALCHWSQCFVSLGIVMDLRFIGLMQERGSSEAENGDRKPNHEDPF